MAPTRALPSGLVTFVFTDIERSSELFARLGEVYPPLLARHNELIRGAAARHGGAEVKVEGDAFLLAFDDALAAVRACVDAQRALAAEPWPERAAIRVRMGVHRGQAMAEDGDYVSFVLHQAARVVSAAHGGQVVITDSVAEAVVDHLAGRPLELVDLGRYRLRDFDTPARLWQLAADGLERQFPELTAPKDIQNQLPMTSHAVIGRGDEVRAITDALQRCRLLTLRGPGGIGKTTLAVTAAAEVASHQGVNAAFVALDAVQAAGVEGAVVRALATDAVDIDGVVDRVGRRRFVVVLDNCEHVIDEAASVAARLVSACPSVTLIATSRERLGVEGERVIDVAPLALDAAVQLFCDRAEAAGSPVGPEDRATVESICRRLDALPWAVELAAARCGLLSLVQIDDRLDRRFSVLAGGRRDGGGRHRTLEGAIAWGYDLLSPDEQGLFRRLSGFSSTFTLEDAEWLAEHTSLPPVDALQALPSLVDRSMVVSLGTDGRFRMLESLRAFAVERASEAGEDAAIAEGVSERILAIARSFDRSRVDGHVIGVHLVPYLADIDRTVDTWTARRDDRLHELVARSGFVWLASMSVEAGIARLEPLEPTAEGTEWQPQIRTLLAELSTLGSDLERSYRLDLAAGESQAGTALGARHLRRAAEWLRALGRHDEAEHMLDRAAAATPQDDPHGLVLVARARMDVALDRGDIGTAMGITEAAIASAERAGAEPAESSLAALNTSLAVVRAAGNMAHLLDALDRQEEALRWRRRELAAARGIPTVHEQLLLTAFAAKLVGRLDEGLELVAEAIDEARRVHAWLRASFGRLVELGLLADAQSLDAGAIVAAADEALDAVRTFGIDHRNAAALYFALEAMLSCGAPIEALVQRAEERLELNVAGWVPGRDAGHMSSVAIALALAGREDDARGAVLRAIRDADGEQARSRRLATTGAAAVDRSFVPAARAFWDATDAVMPRHVAELLGDAHHTPMPLDDAWQAVLAWADRADAADRRGDRA